MSGNPPDGSAPDAAANHLEMTAMEPAAITPARRLLIDQLDAWGCTNREDVALVCSELVTNAVVHAGGAVLITVDRQARSIRIDVHDNGPGQLRVRTGPPNPGGLGLRLVAKLSDQWGAQPTPTGKRVWAVLGTDRSHADGATQPNEPAV